MIIEYLQPDASIWDGLTVVNRAFYYAGTLSAAGIVLFTVALGDRLAPYERGRLSRWLIGAVTIGLLFSLLAWPLRAIVLSKDGLEGALRFDLYPVMLRSPIGNAFLIRVVGLMLCLFAFVRRPWGLSLAAIGAFLVCASYVAMGHSTLYRPRQELATLILLHLLAVAFWIGSLPALRIVATRLEVVSAGELMASYSRLATWVVAGLVITGLLATWYLVGSVDLLLGSWHGWALITKTMLVAAMLGLGAWHKWRSTPDMLRGYRMSGEKIRRTITAEMILALLVLYAAAEMVSVHAGGRLPD